MNSAVKKLISEDSDFEEPQTLQDFGPIISNAKDLVSYLLNRGFIPCNSVKDKLNRRDTCVKYSTKIKIKQRHPEYQNIKYYEIRTYKEYLYVFITECSNNRTAIYVGVSIHFPYDSRNYRTTYDCFNKIIHNTKLQNFAYLMEEALTHFEYTQKYIDSGKGFLALVYAIQSVLRPIEEDKT